MENKSKFNDFEALNYLAKKKYELAIERLLRKGASITNNKEYKNLIKKPRPLLRLWIRKNKNHFVEAIVFAFLNDQLDYTLNDIENDYGRDFRVKLEKSLREEAKKIKEKRRLEFEKTVRI